MRDWTQVSAHTVQDQYLQLLEDMRVEKIQHRESIQASLIMAERYEHAVKATEIGGKKVTLKDDKGRTVRVISSDWLPFRIWSSDLDYDIVVLCRTNRNGLFKFFGWTHLDWIIEAPVYWWEPDGVRKGFAHEVEPDTLEPMPEKFDFEITCPHPAGLWNWRKRWECLGCERYYDDEDQRDWDERNERGEVVWREHRGLLIADESAPAEATGGEGSVSEGRE